MTLHQERAAAVRRLVDESPRHREDGRHPRQSGEDRRPAGLAGGPRRALPAGGIPARAPTAASIAWPRIPTIASRSTPRPAAPARRCRRTITRPGRSSPASMAPSATSSTTASTTARARTSCSCARRRPRRRRCAAATSSAYLPDDFHHIETPAGSGNALHLHFYGLSLEHLPDRVSVDMATGTRQALHGQGQDPDAAARRAAGQGDAEVGRGLRLLRRARGRRVLDPGPSAVRHAAAAVAAGAARASPCCPIRTPASC